MIILGISTATVNTSVAVVDTAKSAVIWEKSWPSDYNEAEKTLPAVRLALEKIRALKNEPQSARKEPGEIFVVSGPGSFTGLRIGVAIANSLAWAAGVKISTCTTFEYLAAAVSSLGRKTGESAQTAILLRAGGENYALAFPGKSTGIIRHKIISSADLTKILKKKPAVKYLLADLKPDEKRKIILPEKITWLPQQKVLSLGKTILNLYGNKPRGIKLICQNIVKPVYLQPPKITLSKKPKF